MQKHILSSFLRVCICFLLISGYTVTGLKAQDKAAQWTPEEQRELFGYCEKPELMKQLKISSETADRIGQINYWATVSKISVAANTNDTFATPKEVEDVVVKKYKALGLSADQLKDLLAKRAISETPQPCAVTKLNYNPVFDTMPAPRALLLYKTQFRKQLIDKSTVMGRQADMLLEIEVWKQKEAITIAAIPVTDFSRIRKTVAMYNERERRFKVVGVGDQQLASVIDFFDQHQLEVKK